MKKIERIYVACYKRDFHLARICVASIRYWHPDIPITLVKDFTLGGFDTSEIEDLWNVSTLTLERKKYGWSFIKLEPFFLEPKQRIMVIDSDIVFVGPLLDKLDQHDEDFVVHASYRPEAEIRSHYYKSEAIRERLNSDFQYPGYVFNCGHIVATSGILKKADFDNLICWEVSYPDLKHPNIFSHADQGIMNYALHRRQQLGEITVGSFPFSIWGNAEAICTIDIDAIIKKLPTYYNLIHYAGTKPLLTSGMPRSDILNYFEDYYYSVVPFAGIRKNLRNAYRWAYFTLFDTSKRLLPRRIIDLVKMRI